jgi:cytochrome P450
MRLSATVTQVDVSDIRLYDPAWFVTNDPHAAWYTLRTNHPVFWQQMPDGTGFWAVTRHRDVCEVLSNSALFTSRHGNLLTNLNRGELASDKMLATTDPPLHTIIKRQLNNFFTRSAVQKLEADIRKIARRVIAAGIDGEVFDLASYTAMFPVAVTALLLGLDEKDWKRLKEFSYIAIADQDTDIASPGDDNILERAHAEIFAYFASRIATADRTDQGVISALLGAQTGDRRFGRAEVLFNCYSLLLGATVTTAHAANVAILSLAEYPDQDRIWRESGCTAPLVEEVLRWSSPANHFLRYATADTAIADFVIKAGQPVTVWLGSANRDEEVFKYPYRFDANRMPVQHIAFGVGSHRCIGAPLARLSLTVFLEEVRNLVESFNIGSPVTHLASNFIAGIKSLPASITLKSSAYREFSQVKPLDSII